MSLSYSGEKMQNNKGFTLIELIVVIAILAILAVALIPLINSFIEKSRVSRIMSTISSLETAAVAFNADIGSFPTDLGAGFEGSELSISDRNNWDGPYLNRNTEGISPWGTSMLLTIAQLQGVGSEKLEYVLLIGSGTSNAALGGSPEASVPAASFSVLDSKMDDGDAGEGKARRLGGGTNSTDSAIAISLITDAYTEIPKN